MRNFRIHASLLTLLGLCVLAVGQDSVDRLISEALKPSSIESNLRQLTDEIGGRVPGTPAMRKATDWGVAALKAAGGENVHTEEFTIPYSWAEGATRMNVSAPENFSLRVVSLAWAPALAAHKHVGVVDV